MSIESLAIARQTVPDALFVNMDLCRDVPKGWDENFGVVLYNMFWEHVDNTQLAKVIENSYKMLKKDGMLLSVMTNPEATEVGMMNDKMNAKILEAWYTVEPPWGGKLRNFYRPIETIERIVASVGFDITAKEILKVPEDARFDNPIKYRKYAENPPRLLIQAVKR